MVLIVQFSVQNYNFSYAEDTNFPDWTLTLYSFWNEGKISYKEFTDAVEFLDNNNIIKLTLEKGYDTKTNFLVSQMQTTNPDMSSCSKGWYVTGYFIPVESDYVEGFTNVLVDGEKNHYKTDFLNDVKIEGWGRTHNGDYLGWYDNSFHLNDSPLDFFGNSLEAGIVAIDPIIIKQNSKILIPTLSSPWDNIVYSTSDIGPAIKEKHIDVFTGEGHHAQLEANKITSYENEVCIKQ